MPHLLVVETSPRGDYSLSRNLTRRFVAEWQAAHPDGQVVNRDLMETNLPFVNAPWLQAYFTPPEQHSTEMKEVLRLSNELVAELLATDHLVIATPVYNYNVPAALKAWVDHIVRKGLTLGMDGKGLVTGKKATVLLASGGVYTESSPIRDRDIATQYLRMILNVIGITDVTFIAAGGAKAVDMGEIGREDFLDKFQGEIEAEAAPSSARSMSPAASRRGRQVEPPSA
jgi:FMN-dependent NADH-azoreductase